MTDQRPSEHEGFDALARIAERAARARWRLEQTTLDVWGGRGAMPEPATREACVAAIERTVEEVGEA